MERIAVARSVATKSSELRLEIARASSGFCLLGESSVWLGLISALENAAGSRIVKFPCPSLTSTATGDFNHAVLTTEGLRFAPHPAVTFADRQKYYEQEIGRASCRERVFALV